MDFGMVFNFLLAAPVALGCVVFAMRFLEFRKDGTSHPIYVEGKRSVKVGGSKSLISD